MYFILIGHMGDQIVIVVKDIQISLSNPLYFILIGHTGDQIVILVKDMEHGYRLFNETIYKQD